MTYCKHSIICLTVFLLGLTPLAAQTPNRSHRTAATPVGFPSFAKVAETASLYLESLTARQEDDLLSRGDVVPLFERLKAIGWQVTDARDIEQQLLPDSDWLVRTLRTGKGTRFMRDMSSFPGGYDRLDRMRQFPHGKQQLQGLINSPDGAELIDYLTNTKQGRRTGADLSSSRGAFNTPTRRLYTKADVYQQIKTSYAAEAARRLQATSAPAKPAPRSKPTLQPRPRPQPEPAPAESSASSEEE